MIKFALPLVIMLIVPIVTLLDSRNVYAAKDTAIYFPLYTPPGPVWDNMLTYRQAHPSLEWIAIIDPHHGRGQKFDLVYAENIAKLQANDVIVLGYVSTLWSAKDPNAVKEDIRKYDDWYRVDGIMLDEMVSFAGAEGLYSDYTNYAKSLGMSSVIGNVGTNTLPSYVGTVDSISTIEGDRAPPLSWLKGWQLNYDKSNFLYITYSQSWIDKKFVDESTNYVGSLYITDDTMPFPYDNFPSYFDEVVAVLDPQGQNNLRNLSVRASDLLGNSLDGTLVIVSDAANGAPIATLHTQLTHVGTLGSTYAVTALSNQTHIFDHWGDGTTQPTRKVVLDSSTILRAYYRTPSTPNLQSNIVVNALTVNGGQLQMWTSVGIGSSEVKAGLTPLAFAGQDGLTYTVTANSFENLAFDHWEDGSTNPSRAVSLQGGNNAYLTAYYRVEETTPWLLDLTVNSYTLDGTEARRLWSTITPLNGVPAGRYTPMTLAATSGLAYTATAHDNGIYIFDHWDDGSTNRARIVTPFSDTTLTAYYKTSPATLAVKSADPSGSLLDGMYATVAPIDNSTMQTSFTDTMYTGYLGSAYKVTVSDYYGIVFDHWEDGSTSRSRTVMLTTDNTELTAYYKTSDGLTRGMTPITHGADGRDLTVNAATLDGMSLRMWNIVQAESNGSYTVSVHDFEGLVFDHWEDGSKSRTRNVVMGQDTAITAYFRTG